jgi:hypothetical protein
VALGGGDRVTAAEVLLAEHAAVKEEQRARIGFRDNLLYVTLAAMAAVVGGVLPVRHGTELLLALPPVTTVLGWTYVANDQKISAIGRYVRGELATRLREAAALPDGVPVFGWESAHRGEPGQLTRKRLQLAVDLLAFCLAPVAAVVVYWSLGPVRPALLAVSFADVAALGVLAWQIVVHADFGSGPAPAPPVPARTPVPAPATPPADPSPER